MSTAAFQKRLEPGREFEVELIEMLTSHPRIKAVCVNGTEHTHPDFVDLLRSNASKASKIVRYAPDGVFLTSGGDVIHFDAKCAKSIEKDAYETYMGLHSLGCRVVLFVKHNNDIYCQDVQEVRLIEGEVTVMEFPEHRRFPVVDGWISPRRKSGFSANGSMSGTPYREIDFTSMKKWKRTP